MHDHEIPKGPFQRLVVFGESHVRGGGWLAAEGERWADVLHGQLEAAQESQIDYHNAGIGASVISPRSPGYEASTKPSATERLDAEVIAKRPDLLVIAYGLNDMRAGMDCGEFIGEMSHIIERVRASLCPLFVIVNVYHISDYTHYPPFNRGSAAASQAYNDRLRELAGATGSIYADVWSAEGQCDYVIHPDTVHANKVGNMLIANKVFESIVHASPGIVENVQRRDAASAWAERAKARWLTEVEPSHTP